MPGCSIQTVRAVVVESCPIVRSGLRHMLTTCPGIAVLAEARTIIESESIIREVKPQVVLLGVNPLAASEHEQPRELIPTTQNSAVVVLSAVDWDVVLAQAWEVGVSGFLHREVEADRLVDVVRQAAANLRAFTPEQQGRIQAWQQGLGRRLASLSPRECQVFRLLRSGKNAGAIAAELTISPNTAAKQIAAVQSKLGVHSQVELMALVMQHHLEHW